MSRPTYIAICGTGGHGKSAFARALCAHAGAAPEAAIAETSAAVIVAAERLRRQLHVLARANLLSPPLYLPATDILNCAHEWVAEASGGRYKPPQTAFMLCGHRDMPLVKVLVDVIERFRKHPERYLDPVTVDNKASEDYRPLLTVIGYTVGQLATRWLHQAEYPGMTNIWTDIVMHRLDELRAIHSDLPLQIVCGLRLEHDERRVREDRGGYVIEVCRPGHTEPNLPTERRYIRPDYLVLNDGTLAQLEALAGWFWEQISGPSPLLSAGTAANQPLSARQLTGA